MKIKERIVQDKEACDDILHRELFDVNMRLYDTNRDYRKIIYDIIEYMMSCMKESYEDYTTLKGISGANVSIPFNIVIATVTTKMTVLINPKILRCSRKMITITSNCGSLNLKTDIEVERPEWVSIGYYDMNGAYKTIEKATISEGGSTIIHEIEHNLGILITDKQNKKKKGK